MSQGMLSNPHMWIILKCPKAWTYKSGHHSEHKKLWMSWQKEHASTCNGIYNNKLKVIKQKSANFFKKHQTSRKTIPALFLTQINTKQIKTTIKNKKQTTTATVQYPQKHTKKLCFSSFSFHPLLPQLHFAKAQRLLLLRRGIVAVGRGLDEGRLPGDVLRFQQIPLRHVGLMASHTMCSSWDQPSKG